MGDFPKIFKEEKGVVGRKRQCHTNPDRARTDFWVHGGTAHMAERFFIKKNNNIWTHNSFVFFSYLTHQANRPDTQG